MIKKDPTVINLVDLGLEVNQVMSFIISFYCLTNNNLCEQNFLFYVVNR